MFLIRKEGAVNVWRRSVIIYVFLLAPLMCGAVYGADPGYEELLREVRTLKAKVNELEKRLEAHDSKLVESNCAIQDVRKSLIEYRPGEGVTIEEQGLNVCAGVTFVAQGSPNANNAGDSEDSVFDAEFSADVFIEKGFGDWGLAFLHLEAGQGDGIEDELLVFSNVNREAGNTDTHFNAAEWWYEHYFLNKQLEIRLGKMDAGCFVDQNEYAHCEITQFLGRIFRNAPTIEFPLDNALGANLNMSIEPISFMEFELGYYEADADWEDVFNHGFYTFQINLIPASLLDIDPDQWGGNYRFYWWMNDQFHTELVEDGEIASDDKMNYGFGFSCDQMVTDVFGVFGRFGWQRPDVIPVDGSATLEWTWSSGIQMKCSCWNRGDDVLAFAIGQAFPSREYDDASADNHGAGEGHIEAYYNCRLNECLALTPDIQVIWNPNGVSGSSDGDNDAIFIYGVRGQFDF